MNLIDNYLKAQHFLDLSDKNDQASREAKLEYFFHLYADLEKKYAHKVEDVKRIESEHKAELSQLENHIMHVKELTEERERLKLDFEGENEELKNKINALERHISTSKIRRAKSDASNTSEDIDELSEATVEMLVLEGFGNIVAAPNHEKIAVLLADRSKLLDEIDALRKNLEEACKYKSNEDIEHLEMLEDEIDALKLVNNKLSNKIAELNENLDESCRVNQTMMEENKQLKYELLRAGEEDGAFVRSAKSVQTSVDLAKGEEEEEAEIEAGKFEIARLKDDNLNLKMEMDKLYDEIGSFEVENKLLREENKQLKAEEKELKEASQENQTKLSAEIQKLKREIEDLNNELDEMMPFKINFDGLKTKHDELAQFKNDYDQLKLEYDKLSATVQLEKNSASEKNSKKAGQESELKSNLELEWIRGENEKLLLELEKVQEKLADRAHQCSVLKEQLAEKDAQMKEFIGKYEEEQTSEDDLLKLQKKVMELERAVEREREERSEESEAHEERQKDMLKRNDQLWSQLGKMEQNYRDAMEIIRQQTDRIRLLEEKIGEGEKQIDELNERMRSECQLKEILSQRNQDLEARLSETAKSLQQSELHNSACTENHRLETQANADKIRQLNKQVDELYEKLRETEKQNRGLRSEIEGLNKEKLFIISQSDSSHQKVMQDYLALQEKLTAANYQLGKLGKESAQLSNALKEKEQAAAYLESEKTQLAFLLKQETRDKSEALDKIKQMESIISKNMDKINDLSEKLHKVEIQKSKLEVKAKELESMEAKYEQLTSELNDKRETLSQVLEKNGRLESQIGDLERHLNDTKHSLIQSENAINELNHFKMDTIAKSEEVIKVRHDLENEKSRREKAEAKIDELREEYKRIKQKASKLQEENQALRHESVESKSELESVKCKLGLVADKSHTEFEKNNALQDELSETKKKLELSEMKCASFSQKFDLLLKKYETRKVKQKNKVERLWDYLQRERSKYKELLANAQTDLASTKSFLEKETEIKSKQETSYQQLVEEKSKMIASVVDKDAKIREMKRQNILLQSKIKILEEEVDSLHDKIEATVKERNKLRKELQVSLTSATTPDIFEPSLSESVSPANRHRLVSSDAIENSIKKPSSIAVSHWNDLSIHSNSNWDINYNTGYITRIHTFKNKSSAFESSERLLSLSVGKSANEFNKQLNSEFNFGGSMATEINSISSTPRSFR